MSPFEGSRAPARTIKTPGSNTQNTRKGVTPGGNTRHPGVTPGGEPSLHLGCWPQWPGTWSPSLAVGRLAWPGPRRRARLEAERVSRGGTPEGACRQDRRIQLGFKPAQGTSSHRRGRAPRLSNAIERVARDRQTKKGKKKEKKRPKQKGGRGGRNRSGQDLRMPFV